MGDCAWCGDQTERKKYVSGEWRYVCDSCYGDMMPT